MVLILSLAARFLTLCNYNTTLQVFFQGVLSFCNKTVTLICFCYKRRYKTALFCVLYIIYRKKFCKNTAFAPRKSVCGGVLQCYIVTLQNGDFGQLFLFSKKVVIKIFYFISLPHMLSQEEGKVTKKTAFAVFLLLYIHGFAVIFILTLY